MTFNMTEHLIDLQGKKYLPVAFRLVWFREEHPNGAIVTEIVNVNEVAVIVKATVMNNEGHVLSVGHGTAAASGKGSWTGRAIEKAETAAIGRALAHAGYGTQFSPDDDEGDNLSDSPVQRKQATVTNVDLSQQTVPSPRPNPLKVLAQQTPSPKWTRDEQLTYGKDMNQRHKLTTAQMCKALGLDKRLDEWQGSFVEAIAKTETWVSQQ